jgi:hypothetical protein
MNVVLDSAAEVTIKGDSKRRELGTFLSSSLSLSLACYVRKRSRDGADPLCRCCRSDPAQGRQHNAHPAARLNPTLPRPLPPLSPLYISLFGTFMIFLQKTTTSSSPPPSLSFPHTSLDYPNTHASDRRNDRRNFGTREGEWGSGHYRACMLRFTMVKSTVRLLLELRSESLILSQACLFLLLTLGNSRSSPSFLRRSSRSLG